MKFVSARPYADPDVAARKLLEIANAHEPHVDGRILIERGIPGRPRQAAGAVARDGAIGRVGRTRDRMTRGVVVLGG